MFAATILLAQLRCAPTPSGSVDCYDAQKGGAPVVEVERNLFGGYDVRRDDGTVERCDGVSVTRPRLSYQFLC